LVDDSVIAMDFHKQPTSEVRHAQKKEVLRRLQEIKTDPAALEDFNEAELNRMILKITKRRSPRSPGGS
jgi:hypothetical protein